MIHPVSIPITLSKKDALFWREKATISQGGPLPTVKTIWFSALSVTTGLYIQSTHNLQPGHASCRHQRHLCSVHEWPRTASATMASLRTLHIAGANITIPFKEAVIPFLDSVSESAEIIGAINTIARNGDKLKGYNTNAIRLMDALEEIGCAPAGKTAMILGAGGAAKAAAFVLKWLKADQIFVVSKNGQSPPGGDPGRRKSHSH
ncbi:MAG: hypothetical protein R2861_10790 [Desulfobacterales bacterium]